MADKKKDGRANLRAVITDFTDKELKQLESAAGLGLNEREIAKLFSISRSTLQRRIANDQRVTEAVERGRIQAKLTVRSTAFTMAASGKQPAMTMFWLKMYDKWQPDVEHDEDAHTETLIGSALIAQELAASIANMTPEQVAKELQVIHLESKHGVYTIPDDDDAL